MGTDIVTITSITTEGTHTPRQITDMLNEWTRVATAYDEDTTLGAEWDATDLGDGTELEGWFGTFDPDTGEIATGVTIVGFIAR